MGKPAVPNPRKDDPMRMNSGIGPQRRRGGWPKGRYRLPEDVRSKPRVQITITVFEEDRDRAQALLAPQRIKLTTFVRECFLRSLAAAEQRARKAVG